MGFGSKNGGDFEASHGTKCSKEVDKKRETLYVPLKDGK